MEGHVWSVGIWWSAECGPVRIHGKINHFFTLNRRRSRSRRHERSVINVNQTSPCPVASMSLSVDQEVICRLLRGWTVHQSEFGRFHINTNMIGDEISFFPCVWLSRARLVGHSGGRTFSASSRRGRVCLDTYACPSETGRCDWRTAPFGRQPPTSRQVS